MCILSSPKPAVRDDSRLWSLGGQMSIPAKLTIFRNKRDEEVARVIFDENFPPGWRIQSKVRQSFEHKFSTEQEAFNAWHHDFDPETGRLWQHG
jgi:hypothetical protein